jgi:hypothetical protein
VGGVDQACGNVRGQAAALQAQARAAQAEINALLIALDRRTTLLHNK